MVLSSGPSLVDNEVSTKPLLPKEQGIATNHSNSFHDTNPFLHENFVNLCISALLLNGIGTREVLSLVEYHEIHLMPVWGISRATHQNMVQSCPWNPNPFSKCFCFQEEIISAYRDNNMALLFEFIFPWMTMSHASYMVNTVATGHLEKEARASVPVILTWFSRILTSAPEAEWGRVTHICVSSLSFWWNYLPRLQVGLFRTACLIKL